jgi:hypothetical protein
LFPTHKASEAKTGRNTSKFHGILMEAVFGLQVTHCVFGFSEGEYFAVRIDSVLFVLFHNPETLQSGRIFIKADKNCLTF